MNKHRFWGIVIGLLALSILGMTSLLDSVQAATESIPNISAKPFATGEASTDYSGHYGDVTYVKKGSTLTISGGNLYGADVIDKNDDGTNDFRWARDQSITTVVISGKLYLHDTGGQALFMYLVNLNKIVNLSNIDTSDATDLSDMFLWNVNLPGSVDLTSFNTRRVTNLSHMFDQDTHLTKIDISNFNTSQVDDMSYMFSGDTGLKNIIVPSWNTSNLKKMDGMFMQDYMLSSIDLTNFNTSNVRTMGVLFTYDYSLKKLDLSSFDTSKISSPQNLYWMLSVDINASNTPGKVPLHQSQLEQLTLGKKTKLNSQVLLPLPDGGKQWQAVDEQAGGTVTAPKGDTYKTSNDLINAHNAMTPPKTETYVPERGIPSTAAIKTKADINLANGTQFDPATAFISITTPEGKTVTDWLTAQKDGVTVDTSQLNINKQGTYVVTYSYQGKTATTKVHVGAPQPNPQPAPSPQPSPTPTPNNNGGGSNNNNWNPSTPDKSQTINLPNYAVVKGSAVYATKKIYLYKHGNFKKSQRIATYPKQKRINRPMFVVTGYTRSKGGALRYKVRDVNHHSKTDGKKGYITANRKYVVNVYYKTMPKNKKITVINPKGVYSYKTKRLTGQTKHFKKGTHLRVKKLVKHNLSTRYQLTNGKYVTANKKLIIQGNY